LDFNEKSVPFHLVGAVSFSPFCFGSERSSSVCGTSLDFSRRPVGLVPLVISFSPKVLASGFSLGIKNPFCCPRLFLPAVIPQRNRIPSQRQFRFFYSVFLGSQRCLLASGLCFATEEIAARRSYCQILIFQLPFCSPARRWMSFFPTERSHLVSLIFPIEIPVPHEFSDLVFSLPLI
jgi:hypothetical protein